MNNVNCNGKDSYYDRKLCSMEGSYRECMYSLIGMLIILLCMLLTGCKSIQYVPVEKVRTEYVNKTDTFIQKDSVFVKDSTSVTVRNDTVLKEMWHTIYKDKWREVVKIDSFIKLDSIQIPYPVEKKLSKWEQVKMDAGGLAIGGCLFLIILIIGYCFWKIRK